MSADRPRVLGAMAIGAVAISFAAIFFRRAAIDPLVASALRLGIAAVVLSPAVLRARLDGRLHRAAALAGLFYAIHFGTWVASLSRTTIAASVTLVTATPLLSAGLAVLERRDRPERRHVLGIALALGGVALIAGDDLAAGRIDGDLLALAGAAAMAAYLRLVRGLGDALEPIAFSALAAGWGALFLVPAILVSDAPLAWPSTAALGWIALAALVPQVVGHTLLTYALRRATPTEVGIATAAEPVLSTLLGWVWLAEVPTGVVLAGCALTLVGVLVGARPAAVGRPVVASA